MRLDQLIRDLRGEGRDDEISYRALSERAANQPSMPTFHRLGSAPKDEEWIDTAWGTRATLNRAIDTGNVIGIAAALRVSVRTVWLAIGESLGLPDMFTGPDDRAVAQLIPGWWRLDSRRLGILRTVITVLLDDQDRETRVEELEALLASQESTKRVPRGRGASK